jgi:hypothetical protein
MKNNNLDFRASTLFPIYIQPDIKNRINFLSYWKLKNKLDNVGMLLSFRDKEGKLVCSDEISIAGSPKSYDIDLNYFIDRHVTSSTMGFAFSVEVEVFFEKEPLIKYPALVYCITNGNDSSAVHACLRSYNPSEIVPREIYDSYQTGFDIFFEDSMVNYIVLIGGSIQTEYCLNIIIQSANGELELVKSITLFNDGCKKLFQISINDLFDGNILNNIGLCKVSIKHDVKDIFPRFYVGNLSDYKLPSLTHTFFDENKLSNKKAIKINDSQNIFTAFSFPLLDSESFTTSISSYMANKFWDGRVAIKLLDSKGTVVAVKELSSKAFELFQKISTLNIYDFFAHDEFYNDSSSCKFELFADTYPSRFKLGLNIAKTGALSSGTNICFSPPIVNDITSTKEFSSAWCPIGGPSEFSAFFQNTWVFGTKKVSKVEARIFSVDGEELLLEFELLPDASLRLSPVDNPDICSFLNGDLGYCFFKSSNPYFTAWYLSTGAKGVGGDHAF